jgi:hypothetical protein
MSLKRTPVSFSLPLLSRVMNSLALHTAAAEAAAAHQAVSTQAKALYKLSTDKQLSESTTQLSSGSQFYSHHTTLQPLNDRLGLQETQK